MAFFIFKLCNYQIALVKKAEVQSTSAGLGQDNVTTCHKCLLETFVFEHLVWY